MSNEQPEEKHVPMQHQSDFNLENYTSGGPVKPIGLPIVGEPGPEFYKLSDGTVILPFRPTQRELELLGFQERMEKESEKTFNHLASLFGIPVKYHPMVSPGKAVLFEGDEVKVFDLPKTPDEKEGNNQDGEI